MIGETIVAELKSIIKSLKYQGAIWEWAIWQKDSIPKVHFLKIELTSTHKRRRATRLFSASGLSLFRETTSLTKVVSFLDYCVSTRQQYEQVKKIPFGEPGASRKKSFAASFLDSEITPSAIGWVLRGA